MTRPAYLRYEVLRNFRNVRFISSPSRCRWSCISRS
jgi:hypothetical protein